MDQDTWWLEPSNQDSPQREDLPSAVQLLPAPNSKLLWKKTLPSRFSDMVATMRGAGLLPGSPFNQTFMLTTTCSTQSLSISYALHPLARVTKRLFCSADKRFDSEDSLTTHSVPQQKPKLLEILHNCKPIAGASDQLVLVMPTSCFPKDTMQAVDSEIP